jgi:dTDP-4-dehydrorhamnose 3,5-epimerase
MHYQVEPHAEAKLIRCSRGRVFDVVVDLRPTSPTRLRWVALTLAADSSSMLYIPEGCAHGFQTLEEDTDLFYQISTAYHPEAARGVRPEDPALAIPWPLPISCISERDRSFPLL